MCARASFDFFSSRSRTQYSGFFVKQRIAFEHAVVIAYVMRRMRSMFGTYIINEWVVGAAQRGNNHITNVYYACECEDLYVWTILWLYVMYTNIKTRDDLMSSTYSYLIELIWKPLLTSLTFYWRAIIVCVYVSSVCCIIKWIRNTCVKHII